MPHLKCTACRTRLYSASILTEIVGDHCPECDALLEPVGDLSEVVGFRAITSLHDDQTDESSAHDRVTAGVGDLLARRARHEQARLDVERWGDDDGGAAVAMQVPQPAQRPLTGKTRV